MKAANSFAIVLVTAPSRVVARKLARAALEQRLIACANLVPGVESLYWWQGKVESGKEVLMVMKSRKSLLPKLEALIQTLHPYDTPEFIVLPPSSGSQRFLEWLRVETS